MKVLKEQNKRLSNEQMKLKTKISEQNQTIDKLVEQLSDSKDKHLEEVESLKKNYERNI